MTDILQNGLEFLNNYVKTHFSQDILITIPGQPAIELPLKAVTPDNESVLLQDNALNVNFQFFSFVVSTADLGQYRPDRGWIITWTLPDGVTRTFEVSMKAKRFWQYNDPYNLEIEIFSLLKNIQDG